MLPVERFSLWLLLVSGYDASSIPVDLQHIGCAMLALILKCRRLLLTEKEKFCTACTIYLISFVLNFFNVTFGDTLFAFTLTQFNLRFLFLKLVLQLSQIFFIHLLVFHVVLASRALPLGCLRLGTIRRLCIRWAFDVVFLWLPYIVRENCSKYVCNFMYIFF